MLEADGRPVGGITARPGNGYTVVVGKSVGQVGGQVAVVDGRHLDVVDIHPIRFGFAVRFGHHIEVDCDEGHATVHGSHAVSIVRPSIGRSFASQTAADGRPGQAGVHRIEDVNLVSSGSRGGVVQPVEVDLCAVGVGEVDRAEDDAGLGSQLVGLGGAVEERQTAFVACIKGIIIINGEAEAFSCVIVTAINADAVVVQIAAIAIAEGIALFGIS